MKIAARLILVLALTAALLPARAASAQAPVEPASCLDFQLLDPTIIAIPGAYNGSEYCITVPTTVPLRGLVIFAHGYVFAYPNLLPPIIPWDQLILRDPDTGVMLDTLPRMLNSLGFVFATTSYPKNGLAIKEGVASVVELVQVVQGALASMIPPGTQVPVFLVGASEGGIVTTLAVERFPQIFTGGVAACGPVGDFLKQINYWSDFRVLFDYYFGPVLGSDPLSISPEVMANWYMDPSPLKEQVRALIANDLANNNGVSTSRLLTAAKAPIDPLDPSTIETTILGILEYNVFATNEALAELGGNPYSNEKTTYYAFPIDRKLNKKVARVPSSAVSPAALAEIAAYYQTSGQLSDPLVLLHTTGDEIVPFWHTGLYLQKAYQTGSLGNLVTIPILRYGHCNFTPAEALFAFEVMAYKAQMQAFSPAELEKALPEAASREAFQELKKQNQEAYK